eukprot:jgi/Hompol1/6144/HPOL_002189-RA
MQAPLNTFLPPLPQSVSTATVRPALSTQPHIAHWPSTIAQPPTSLPHTLANSPFRTINDSWLFTEEELLETPSCEDGIPIEEEIALRLSACRMIERCGPKLRLPHTSILIAKILLHRFYMRMSFKKYHNKQIAATALFLCGKLGAGVDCAKLLDGVAHICGQDARGSVSLTEHEFKCWKDLILKHEQTLALQICFDTDPDTPHRYAHEFVKGLKGTSSLVQLALKNCDEALCTTLCIRYSAKEIATAAVVAAFESHNVAFPKEVGGSNWGQLQCGLRTQTLQVLCCELVHAKDKVKTMKLWTKLKQAFVALKERRLERAAKRKAEIAAAKQAASASASASAVTVTVTANTVAASTTSARSVAATITTTAPAAGTSSHSSIPSTATAGTIGQAGNTRSSTSPRVNVPNSSANGVTDTSPTWSQLSSTPPQFAPDQQRAGRPAPLLPAAVSAQASAALAGVAAKPGSTATMNNTFRGPTMSARPASYVESNSSVDRPSTRGIARHSPY